MSNVTEQRFATTLLTLSQKNELAQLSTTQIIQTSGLGRQTFYNHFRDKYQLITWIFKNDAQTGLLASTTQNWQTIMCHVFTNINRHRKFYQQAFQMRGQNALKDDIRSSDQQLYTKLFEQLTQLPTLTPDMRFALDFYSSGCFEATLRWLQLEQPYSPAEHARRVWLAMPQLLREQIA